MASRSEIIRASFAFVQDFIDTLRPGGASHYLGAALGEVFPILFEVHVFERPVHWTLPQGPEFDLLVPALDKVGGPLPVPSGSPPWPVDHLWFAGVLTNADEFPALHHNLRGCEGVGADLARDTVKAEFFVADALDHVALPATLSTTDEELPFFQAACAARGWRLEVPEQGRPSGVMGSVVKHIALTG